MPSQAQDVSADTVRAHLAAILNSQPFAGSARLRRFLQFVVEQKLDTDGTHLKEYTIGVHVFDRPVDYDPRIDPTVRVHAGKLRAKLSEYYFTDGRDASVRIDLVKGSYVPVFTTRAIPPPAPASVTPRRRWLHVVAIVAGAASIAVVAGLWRRSEATVTVPAWEQITSFADSATQPALSPDGTSLAFVRGPGTFVTRGQIFVKALPHGPTVQLTDDDEPKMHPVFSPDGSRIAYTKAPGRVWDTWTVPVSGGKPNLFLSNAQGLRWLNDTSLLFSEIKSGLQTAVVTSDGSRRLRNDVYVPSHDLGMAHFSYPSPDRRWVLIAEMDDFPARWLPCRLTPLRARSSEVGRRVGPNGACTSAAWSPDGRWMYFSADTGAGSHIWRQSFPDGPPQQITEGPTEEEGIAIAPDGRSLVTSVGLRHSSVWVHDESGDRQISVLSTRDVCSRTS